ncbi:MAG TPA: hypothetical protein VHS06_12405 [Chloroflexota bacterium]|nr:hypothetical protein [Chloroflexota bacterium]
MATSRVDYTAQAVEASRSVLLELCHLLGEYRDDIVVIGGWVPELLISRGDIHHVGSMDVDLALNHRNLQEAGYRTIQELLLFRGYRQGNQPFVFHRLVRVGDHEVSVEVDLLAGEYQGTGSGHRTQKVLDVRARKARGADLAFEMVRNVEISGTLPGGGKDTADVRVAAIVPFLVMKGMALHDRMKEKDAWDIYFCLRYYPGGLDALVKEFQPHLDHGLVREGLSKIAEKFASPEHVGPRFVADFDGLDDPEERALRERDAYERVSLLLQQLKVAH